ncbi:hypothetical protein AKJ09_00521 [Labilithrix luteola]|uniref:IgGFc-binding protein N-terminal domain-containing protein n=1 Tax=Labilithrix luteola TaxID=1391654 RepID=A0A0K1PK15_9BACT|nr:IgGFc-binding protein [Labilithrix luteola]AKU93857.1 hypothetical protein AKJ09_00521 [Labilithrix luteola]
MKRNSVRRAAPLVFLGLLALAFHGQGCGGDRGSFGEAPPLLIAGDGGEGGVDIDASCTSSLYCSRDLKTVYRGCGGGQTGEIVETCEAGKGCGDGHCVDACLAAEVSKGSTGCAFYAVAPDDLVGACYAALVANTWDQPATLTGEWDGKPLDISQSIYDVKKNADGTETYTRIDGPLAPGQMGVVFLAQSSVDTQTPCPAGVKSALDGPVTKKGTSINRGFRIASSVPVSAYAIFPYGGARGHYPTATLLLPISSWETSYVAVSPTRVEVADWEPTREGSEGTDMIKMAGPRYVQIVAAENDTTVSMKPIADVADGQGVVGVAAGRTKSWTLQRGQVLQLAQNDDLTGTIVNADKPVGLFGGAYCSFVPSTWWACDLMQQQIPPPSQWGHEYAVAPFRPRWSLDAKDDVHSRPESAFYTVVGAVDGTTLTYDPSPPGFAPTTLAAGQRATFETSTVFTVRSQDEQHPFFVGSFMPSADYRGGHTGAVPGDPEFVNVVATDQYLDRYVFFTDFTFAQTTLTVVRRKTASGFAPVNLDCAGEISDFRPIGTSGEYEYAWLLLTSSYIGQSFGASTCGYGRHEITSSGPFEVTVWGTDYYASYGYPGGTGLRPISPVKPSVVN